MKKILCLVVSVMGFCLSSFAFDDSDFEVRYDLDVPNDETVKSRQESGTAYVDFLTGKSNIVKTYHNNSEELGKIQKTISAVRNDKDITIKSISIIGYASPEGTESMNYQLSGDRTLSLANYIHKNFGLPSNIRIKTKAGGEDWALLRSEVEKSSINDKDGILAIIDDKNLTADEKDKKLQEVYPVEYKWMYDNIFPMLRRSVYVIDYTVRNYTDLNEIGYIANNNPQKLSLYEIYRLVKRYQIGSDDFYRYIFLGARMFPHNELANLNAGAASIAKRDYSSAFGYLSKSGTSNLANYNRGIYYALTGDYPEALNYFNQSSGIYDSLSYMRMIESYNSGDSSDDIQTKNNEVSVVDNKIPKCFERSNLDIEAGWSVTYGQFVGLKYSTPNLSETNYSKIYLAADIGKEYIFNWDFKNRTNWDVSLGYMVGWPVDKAKNQYVLYNIDLIIGNCARYDKTAVTLDLLSIGYIYKRFTAKLGILGVVAAGNKCEYEANLTVSLRLF